jgi:type VI secretion system Hcp family effector
MRTPLQSLPASLFLTFVLTAVTFAGRAQHGAVLSLTGKPSGAIKAGGSQTSTINSVIEASSIMQITRSNLKEYTTSPKPLTITKQVDGASPSLLQAHNTSESIPQISLTLYKPGDNTKYKVITLDDATISNLTVKKVPKDPNSKPKAGQHVSAPTTSDTEEVTFTFHKISIVYYSGGSTSTSDDWSANNQ